MSREPNMSDKPPEANQKINFENNATPAPKQETEVACSRNHHNHCPWPTLYTEKGAHNSRCQQRKGRINPPFPPPTLLEFAPKPGLSQGKGNQCPSWA
jgi:hypothetical protein